MIFDNSGLAAALSNWSLAHPRAPKSNPNRLQVEFENSSLFPTQFFNDFGSRWALKMDSELSFRALLFEKIDFVKIVLPSRRELNF